MFVRVLTLSVCVSLMGSARVSVSVTAGDGMRVCVSLFVSLTSVWSMDMSLSTAVSLLLPVIDSVGLCFSVTV